MDTIRALVLPRGHTLHLLSHSYKSEHIDLIFPSLGTLNRNEQNTLSFLSDACVTTHRKNSHFLSEQPEQNSTPMITTDTNEAFDISNGYPEQFIIRADIVDFPIHEYVKLASIASAMVLQIMYGAPIVGGEFISKSWLCKTFTEINIDSLNRVVNFSLLKDVDKSINGFNVSKYIEDYIPNYNDFEFNTVDYENIITESRLHSNPTILLLDNTSGLTQGDDNKLPHDYAGGYTITPDVLSNVGFDAACIPSNKTGTVYKIKDNVYFVNAVCPNDASNIVFYNKVFTDLSDFMHLSNEEIEAAQKGIRDNILKKRIKNIVSKNSDRLNNKMDGINRQINEQTCTLANKVREKNDIALLLQSANMTNKALFTKLVEDINTISAMDKIEGVLIDNGSNLVISTEELYFTCTDDPYSCISHGAEFEDRDGERNEDDEIIQHNIMDYIEEHDINLQRKFSIGKMTISINLDSNDITMLSSNPIHGYWNMSQHPHIDGSGAACWGNAAEPISDLTGNREYVMLTEFLLSFLSSINIDDSAGRLFFLWPEYFPPSEETTAAIAA